MIMLDKDQFACPTSSLSPFQERLWLLQQHNPALVLKRSAGWALAEGVEATRLFRAVQEVCVQHPDLSGRYRFAADGVLRQLSGDVGDCIRIQAITHRDDMFELMLNRQTAPWRGAEESPLEVVIALCPQQIYLGVLCHQILDERVSPQVVLDHIHASYQGVGATPLCTRVVPAPDMHRSVLSLPRLSRGLEPGAVLTSGPVPSPYGNCAVRSVMELDLGRVSHVVPPHQRGHIPPWLAARFALYIAAQAGINQLDLWLRHRQGDRLVPLTTGDSAETLVERLLNASAQDQSPGCAVPFIEVTLHERGDLRSFVAAPLPLQTAESTPDVALDITQEGPERVILTLTTGAALSPHAGALLLDRFVAGLGQCQVMEDCVLADPSSTMQQRTRPAGFGTPLQDPPSVAAATSGSAPVAADATAGYAPLILAEFQRALNAPDMSETDDFFDFGGHSLLATRIMGHLLKDHGIEVQFNDFFKNATAQSLAAMATMHQDAGKDDLASDPVGETAPAPMGLAQATLWNAYKAFEFGPLFNLPFVLEFQKDIDEEAFGAALRDVVIRHASLRSLYSETPEGTPVQTVVPVRQLSDYQYFWTSTETSARTLTEEAHYQFDLTRELPIRFKFIRDSRSGRQRLSFLVQHMAVDEWSINTLMADLRSAYAARVDGQAPRWAAPVPLFNDFARQQQAIGVDREHLAYWVEKLDGAQRNLNLFGVDNATAEASLRAGTIEITFAQPLTDGLYAQAKQAQSSLFSIAYTSVAVALHRLGGRSDITIGTSASGRSDPNFYDTVGYFTTMIAHRIKVQETETLGGLLAVITQDISDSMAYADVPVTTVQEALPTPVAGGLLFSAYVQIHAKNALNGTFVTGTGDTVRHRQVDPIRVDTLFDLWFEFTEDDIGDCTVLRLLLTYKADLYSAAQIAELGAQIEAVLALMATEDGLACALTDL